MTYLSTGAMSQNLYVNKDGFVPFVVHAAFNAPAGYGKKWELINEIEKNLNIIENMFVAFETGQYDSSGDVTIEFSLPLKYTRQFGDKPVEFTINGNAKIIPKSSIANPPTEDVYNDASRGLSGYGATNNGTRVVNPVVADQAVTLWNALAAMSPPSTYLGPWPLFTITSLEYNMVMYGARYFHRGGYTINGV